MRKITLLIASLFITIGAMAQFTQSITDITSGNIAVTTEYPEGVATAKTAENSGENCNSGSIKVYQVKVAKPDASDITINFRYTSGSHKLVILGVDVLDSNGDVVAGDYHYGYTGGSHSNNDYTLSGIPAGDYKLRYFFCHKAEDHEVGRQAATITVTGLNIVVELSDGVYTIDNIYNGRGSMCYGTSNGTEYFGLTNITLSGYTGNSLTVDPVANKYWYVKTTERGIYFYNIGKGYFLQEQSATNATCAEDAANGFTFERRTENSTNYISVKDGDYYLSYSCGWAPNQGQVRWIADSEAAATLFTFTAVADAATTYATEIATADEKIAAFEADNSEAKAQLREALDNANTLLGSISIGIGVGKYSGDYSQLEAESYLESVEEFYSSIDNTTLAATIAEYTTQINEVIGSYTLNMPENGEYFRVAYDYGGTVGKLYLQGIDSEQIKDNQVSPPAKFSSETGAESIWYYYDGVLYSYTAGKCLREEVNYRGLQSIGTKTTATFSASERVEGKYNIACASYIHATSTGENYYSDHCSGNNCAEHDLILEAVTELPVTVTSAGYATLYAPVALTVPAGVTAHTVTINGEWATLSEPLATIPANTGVVLAGDADTYNFTITTADAFDGTNALRGSAPATYYTEAGTYYALAQLNGEVGFYKDGFNNSRFQNNSHKAYLYVASEAAASAASYSFRFGEGTTGIEQITDNRVQSTAIYDLTGRRVSEIAEKGVYIVGGKKVLVK